MDDRRTAVENRSDSKQSVRLTPDDLAELEWVDFLNMLEEIENK